MGHRKSNDVLYTNDFDGVEEFEDMCFDGSTYNVDEEGYIIDYGSCDSSTAYSDYNGCSDDEFETIDSMDNPSHRKKKRLKVVNDIDYNNVTEESINILDSVKEEETVDANADLTDFNPKVKKARRKQCDIDREIVAKFYENPTAERFSLIWNRFYYGVHAHAQKLVGDWEKAEDLVQETFQRAWEKRFTYSAEKSQYSTWIYTICRNLCITDLKRASRKRCVDMDINEVFDNAYGVDGDYAMNEETYLMNEGGGKIVRRSYDDIEKRIYDVSVYELSKMDSMFQEIVSLKEGGNFTFREIADKLNTKESKVKNNYYKNKEIISDIIKRKYSDLYTLYLEAQHNKTESENLLSVG